jgi:hypothetical protein
MNKCEWKDGEFRACLEAREDAFPVDVVGMYNFCPFCGASLKKPVEIKDGMFGWFSRLDGSGSWGRLNCKIGNEYQSIETLEIYKNFTPGLPEGFNQDGTLKDR